MERRAFVKSGALALVTMGLSPTFLRRTAFGMELFNAPKGKVLICLFQRGAADALNIVVPHGEKAYYAMRPSIAIPQPSRNAIGGAIDLDGFFGLHPALAPLKPLYDRKLLAAVHAVGSPSTTRSHFDAQDYMETGTPDNKGTADGWLNRYLAVKGTCDECNLAKTPFRAVSMTPQTPRILEGTSATVAMNSLDEFSVRATGSSAERLEALYRTGSADLVHGTGAEMFDAVKMLRAANPQKYLPQNGADYPRSQFGLRLLQIAQLIKANVGLEIAFADVGGWDTHVNQGSSTGQLAQRLDDFSRSIAALVTDLGDKMDDVVILTMSEFGRMARENGNRGTDHGHAGALFVIGGHVKGGKVHGRWPGLEQEQLFEGRDLALTTDFRSVFAEVVSDHLGARALDRIFPGFAAAPRDFLGLV
ncbi:MAG: hypothetical protein DMD30_14160 [Gemmatimonadetes bacterium]|nr:MAG: hypothetical protein DMD30_14160 [Gemmatimonadota bacterium]PYP50662.1 MAG: hypothetical protein DMD39_09935 [Gemmatimonadota bacterium]